MNWDEMPTAPGPRTRTFVGREREIGLLINSLKSATGSEGHLYLLAGEPGIGKTRLAEEVSAKAKTRGLTVLWGRCWEPGSTPALWPWQQIVRRALALPAGAYALRRLPPRVRAQLARIDPQASTGMALESQPGDSGQLFSAVLQLLRVITQAVSLLLVIDDMHEADALSQMLLNHLAQNLQKLPLSLIITYRSAEGAAAMAEVIRHGHYVPLAGLTPTETSLMVSRTVGMQPNESLVSLMHNLTRGNPFFIEGVTSLLAARGQLTDERLPDITQLPGDMRMATLSQLLSLSEMTRTLLGFAAVCGNEFDAAVAGTAAGLARERWPELLTEATARGLIIDHPEQAQRHRFAHAIIRDTLYGEMDAAIKPAAHRAVALALEAQHAKNSDEYTEEIAYHYSEAPHPECTAQALIYLERAGTRALIRLAHDAAVEHAQRALLLTDTFSHPLARARAFLLLGRAQSHMGKREAACAAFAEAAQTGRTMREPVLLAEAALGQAASIGGLVDAVPDQATITLLEEALTILPENTQALRLRCQSRLSTELYRAARLEESRALADEAQLHAQTLNDPALHLEAGLALLWALDGPDHLKRRSEVADRCLQIAQALGDQEAEFHVRHVRMAILLTHGDGAGADAEIDQCRDIAQNLRHAVLIWQTGVFGVMRDLMAGRLADAARDSQKVFMLGRDAVGPIALHTYGTEQTDLAWAKGRLGEAVEVHRKSAELAPRASAWVPAMILTCLEAGLEEEARGLLDGMMSRTLDDIPRDALWVISFAMLGEACARLHHPKFAALIYPRLLPMASQAIIAIAGRHCMGSVSRILGLLCATLGRWDESMSHFQHALAFDLQVGAQRWHAYGLCDQASCLLLRNMPGDRVEAQSLLRTAERMGQEMGADGIIVRAQQLLDKSTPPNLDTTNSARILIADSEPHYCEGLSEYLRDTQILIARDAAIATKWILEGSVDVALINSRLIDSHGTLLYQQMLDAHPTLAIGVLCNEQAPDIASHALLDSVVCLLSTSRSKESLAQAIQRLLQGGRIYDAIPRRVDQLGLSERRLDVLRLGATGLSSKEIARRLSVTERTVKDHWTMIFNRLGVKNRAQAISAAYASGLLSRDASR